MLKENVIKVSIGFILGAILLHYIIDLPIIAISVIQLAFYILLYTGLDKVIEVFKKDG